MTINIWTDGACSGNPGPGGWAAIVEKEGEPATEKSGGNPTTTNNQMELTAAIEGLKETVAGATIKLVSDSKYVVDGMKSWIHNWKKKQWKTANGNPVKNQNLWQQLDQLANERKITWQWVKGHAGHPQNERCDALALAQIHKLV